ncbi:hypothetical protein Mapa_016496 [Marchantia paleacea]|nr:hypothetical protein Mapa_016496 [Marchantia paleacea]
MACSVAQSDTLRIILTRTGTARACALTAVLPSAHVHSSSINVRARSVLLLSASGRSSTMADTTPASTAFTLFFFGPQMARKALRPALIARAYESSFNSLTSPSKTPAVAPTDNFISSSVARLASSRAAFILPSKLPLQSNHERAVSCLGPT